MTVTDANVNKGHDVSDADKQQLEKLRLAYVDAQKTGTGVEQAREAYQDLAVKLLIELSGKLDVPPGPDPGSDPGYVKPGGWGSTETNKPDGWKVVPMKDDPTKFKVVDSKGVNIATGFKTQAGAQAYIDAAKAVPGGSCPTGQHMDPATNKCVPDQPAPSGNTDQFGIIKIHADKAGGETVTKFDLKEFERHYASGKPSENSVEYTGKASSKEHNSDVEFTCYTHINGFKTNEPDSISDKLTGPDHSDGACCWVIPDFMSDGSAKKTLETEKPHPHNHGVNPKPVTAIGASIVAKWFGHKAITYVKGGTRYVESWIHFPVDNIDDVKNEQNKWRQYVAPVAVSNDYLKANGVNTTCRIDGPKKGSVPDFKYVSVREISPPT